MDDNFVAKVGRYPNKFVALLRGAKKNQIQSLVNATIKVLRKEIPIKARLRNAIIKHRRFLRHVVHPMHSWASKRRYLIQKGGGVGGAVNALSRARNVVSRIGRVASMSRSLPSLARPLGSLPALSRNLPSIAVMGGRPALRRIPTFANIPAGMRTPLRGSSFGLRAPPRSTSLRPVPPPRSTSLQFSGYSTPHSASHFSGFTPPRSASEFSGFTMPRSDLYGSMPRLNTPGPSVRLAGGESMSNMPTLTRAGSSSSVSYPRYFSDLGHRPGSMRSGPAIAQRSSLPPSEESYRWPGGMRNERVSLPWNQSRTGSQGSVADWMGARDFRPYDVGGGSSRSFTMDTPIGSRGSTVSLQSMNV